MLPVASAPVRLQQNVIRRHTSGGRMALSCGVVLGALSAVLLFNLGDRTLWVPDEGRYAEIAREMLTTGDWIVPRLNGARYFEKPPLVYWLTACSLAVFGRTEWAVRLPVALSAIAGLVVTWRLGRRVAGEKTGLAAAVILALNPLYFALSRFLVLDMVLTVLVTAGLACVWTALEETQRTGTTPRASLLLAAVLFALATLTKGLIGIALPAMIVLPLLGFPPVLTAMRRAPWPAMIALYLLVAAPWFLQIIRKHPEFTWFFFVHEHVARFLKTDHMRTGPVWYFVPVVALGFFPWSCLLPACLGCAPRLSHLSLWFLRSWATMPFLFFSLSQSKLPPYVLPILPALAILVANGVARSFDDDLQADHDRRSLKHSTQVACVAAAFLLLVLALVALRTCAAEDPASIEKPVCALLLSLAAGGLVLAIRMRAHQVRAAFVALALGSAFSFHIGEIVVKRNADRKDARTFAMEIASRTGPGDRVVVLGPLESVSALPFYLERSIVVAGRHFGELTFAHDSMRPDEAHLFATSEAVHEWMKPTEVAALFVTATSYFQEHLVKDGELRLRVIRRHGGRTLFTNRAGGADSKEKRR